MSAVKIFACGKVHEGKNSIVDNVGRGKVCTWKSVYVEKFRSGELNSGKDKQWKSSLVKGFLGG